MIHIFVGNLSWTTTYDDLFQLFYPFGGIEDIDLATNQHNGLPRGFALINMSDATGEIAIAQLHGSKLNGRFINVRKILPKQDKLTA